MRKILALASMLAAPILGCTTTAQPTDSDGLDEWVTAVRACHLDDDQTITPDVDIHACAPEDTKKTTICHIPPGNPSNAHTICVGNAAVNAHVRNHNDPIGPCAVEPPCNSGPDAGTGGGETPDAPPATPPDAAPEPTPDAFRIP
jgi:hypothetical protein